jgi:tetratricopeptide (TPR) repeat protein
LEDQQNPQSIVSDYFDLLKKLISYNRNGIDFLSGQVDMAIEDIDAERAKRLYTTLKEEFAEHAESLMCQARLKLMLGSLEDAEDAIQLANDALRLDPGYRIPFNWLLQQYNKKQKYDLALGICNFVLENSAHLPPDALADVHESRGVCAMAAGDYSDAVESYSFGLDREVKGDKIPARMLTFAFNLTEAQRRQHPKVKNETWNDVISFFDSAGEVSASPLGIQANRWQAIHIGFAMTGNIARAKDSLLKARHAAELLGSAEDLFTVKTYTNVSVKEWLAINDEMLTALDRGELWDGMKLPQPTGSEPPKS